MAHRREKKGKWYAGMLLSFESQLFDQGKKIFVVILVKDAAFNFSQCII